MLERLKSRLVQSRWARVYRQGGDYTWLHEPLVRRYANASVTGSEDFWPMDWFKERYAREPFARGLSLGCGEGPLERDVVRKAICTEIVGIDLLRSALDRARALAREAGLDQIAYRRGDMDRLELGGETFDVVFFHQALHHVRDVDGCLEVVAQALRPGGLLYLDEYVGPARDEWRRQTIAAARAVWRALPPPLRRGRRLGFPIDRSDPSEAVRSSSILPALEHRFTIAERRDYGGNLLAVIHPYLRWDRLQEPAGQDALRALIAAERELLAGGAPSYYTVVIARSG